MKEPHETKPNWERLTVLMHVYIWRNEPAMATQESEGEIIEMSDELLMQLLSYVN